MTPESDLPLAGTDRLVVREEDVSFERLDGEVIAIHKRTGRYYSMSGAAADAWTLLCGGSDARSIAAQLHTAFAGAEVAEDDVIPFLTACAAAGLIERAPGQIVDAAPLPDDYSRGRFVAPILEEFDDMQDLILVDPVHDTSALGWPHTEGRDG